MTAYRSQTNLELARESIAQMRRNGHEMTDQQAETYAQQIARTMNADPQIAD